ncbi:YtxH domain-containing protein [Kineosporia sp. A_224]|uniref:YtxH domain-containing protein n=1 Tax=Kineosporia sp. A_224 TaxID=1962180 RepID=UPI000B4AB8AE|nr:YtxH domain-containing protein [Kineosporia sp. A_224]
MTTHAPESGPQSTKDRAAEVGGTAKEQAANVAGTAKEQAVDVAHDAADQARNLLEELRTNVREQVGTQREKLSQTLDEYATELRQMAGRSESDGPATEAVRQVATKLADMRSYLDGGGDVVTDVRRFARRRPGTFLLACAAVGVLAGRATRGAAAARSQQGGAARHAVDTDGEPQWRRPYEPDEFGSGQYGDARYTGGQHADGQYPQYGTGGSGQYGAPDGEYGTEGGRYGTGGATAPGGTGYTDEQVDAGVERTSDPNLRPTSGPLVSRESAYGGQSATGTGARAAAGDPVPPDLDPGDTRVDRDLTDSGTRPRADGPWERER